jgi:uroporphyrinogen decarboxylase
MIEGSGGREFREAKRMAYGAPALFGRLIDMLAEATIDYLSAQVEAGAEPATRRHSATAGANSPIWRAGSVIHRRVMGAMAKWHT